MALTLVSLTSLGLAVLLSFSDVNGLPTSYEYYTSDGISTGLSADQSYFTLNGKNFSIYSGAMHYFRVPRAYWRDRLKKIRAAGLNTVETYIAWNLHEPQSGVFDFGNGGSEMEDFLHIEEFFQLALEEDLFVIVRSGPYICAEYNFGGFPTWLLREEHIEFRSNEANYMKYVTRYFNVLLPILSKYQFTNGGPIIAFQVENEYGYVAYPERDYLKALHQLFIENYIVELLVSSDGPVASGDRGTLPGVFFQTGNFGDAPEPQFNKLLELQPNRPVMAMEYWIGWFDYWLETHHTKDTATAIDLYERMLKFPASVNIYMFHGGTNFGFSSGGGLTNGLFDNSGYEPITTSYDYDSPLTEAGDYTDKYYQIKELLEKYNPIKTFTPDPPELIPKVAYQPAAIDKQISISDLITNDAPYVIESDNVIAMEKLDINNNSGQSHGYIVYRKENVDLNSRTVLTIEGRICDTAFVLVNGVLVSPVLQSSADLNRFGYWKLNLSALVLNVDAIRGATVDIVVEEWGRVNSAASSQFNHTFKGLWQGDIYFDEVKVSDWKIIPLEFKSDWTNSLKTWTTNTDSGPGLYHATLQITDEPRDTYLDMSNWSKGLVIVNGFPLGKYAKIGPQQALYLPAPFLKKGINDLIIFEHFKAADELIFVTDQIWSTL